MSYTMLKIHISLGVCLLMVLIACQQGEQQPVIQGNLPLFQHNGQVQSRWISFENPEGKKGAGGHENQGAKGHPWESIQPGETKVLMDLKGMGVIHRIWITLNNRSPEMLRGMRLDMYWDGESNPAVSVPFGDFFSIGLGKTAVFENELFSNPEGRSFNSYVQMPFKTAARITVTNETEAVQPNIFYDINYSLLEDWDKDNLYFHAFWSRDTATRAGKDYQILPLVKGKGRFIGTNIGINTNPAYKQLWWGEGEVKVYLDGDDSLATLVGTGTEDYIGSAWEQGEYAHRYQGCLVANEEKEEWAFYRYHIKDPIYFNQDVRVTIQVIGGGMKDKVIEILKAESAPVIPVSIGWATQLNLLDEGISDYENAMDGWMNFYRSDDYSSVAYFYLDRPSSELPSLARYDLRTYRLKPVE